MDLRVSYGLNDSLAAGRTAKPVSIPASRPSSSPPANLPVVQSQPVSQTTGTRLVQEAQEETETGLRRTRIFEQEDGRRFTRIEELTLTARSARRTVIQQNPSGGITRYEEVLDRENTGNFRRTQRFQDEAGEVSTQITQGYKVTDPFILTGGYSPAFTQPSPFGPNRGTQLDLQV